MPQRAGILILPRTSRGVEVSERAQTRTGLPGARSRAAGFELMAEGLAEAAGRNSGPLRFNLAVLAYAVSEKSDQRTLEHPR